MKSPNWRNIPIRERWLLCLYHLMNREAVWLRHMPFARTLHCWIKRRVMSDMERAMRRLIESKKPD